MKTPGNFKPIIYSDFRTDFAAHPITGDIALVTNEDAIVQALRNLMLTSRYERPFNSGIGGGVRGTLFELPSPITEDALKSDITLMINNQEKKRVDLLEVLVRFRPDDNAYAVTITFSVVNKAQPITFTHLLERNR